MSMKAKVDAIQAKVSQVVPDESCTPMYSSCGEYQCPCHDDLRVVLQYVVELEAQLRCPECEGHGSVPCDDFQGDKWQVTCPGCRGTGRR